MSLFLPEKDRRVVPRWRDFRTTAQTGELEREQFGSPFVIEPGKYFEEKLIAWQQERSVETAAEVVTSALVLGRRTDTVEAARFLAEPGNSPTSAVRAIAEQVLSPEDHLGHFAVADLKDIDLEADVLRLRIRSLRLQLRDTPRNALLWVDLARAYSMIGQRDQSVHAMERALRLVHNNRFVLRSAARLFVHIDEPDRAHEVLIHAERTREDPWLLAAEIAVATVADRRALFVKHGRRLLEHGDFPPLHTTELASAIATLDMASGDVKGARQLFTDSLIDPTDNSLAQAGWASTKISGVEVAAELLNKPRSFEARAFREFRDAHWEPAIRHCASWLLDEPFSSRPAALGSYLAGVTEQDYRLSEEFARRGLRANPEDPLLRNNLVVALANQGQVEEAVAEIKLITNPPEELRTTLLATEGLLRFRRGDPTAGRQLYLDSIERASRRRERYRAALAALHLAREELLAGTATADATLAEAAAACEDIEQPDVKRFLQLIRALNSKR